MPGPRRRCTGCNQFRSTTKFDGPFGQGEPYRQCERCRVRHQNRRRDHRGLGLLVEAAQTVEAGQRAPSGELSEEQQGINSLVEAVQTIESEQPALSSEETQEQQSIRPTVPPVDMERNVVVVEEENRRDSAISQTQPQGKTQPPALNLPPRQVLIEATPYHNQPQAFHPARMRVSIEPTPYHNQPQAFHPAPMRVPLEPTPYHSQPQAFPPALTRWLHEPLTPAPDQRRPAPTLHITNPFAPPNQFVRLNHVVGSVQGVEITGAAHIPAQSLTPGALAPQLLTRSIRQEDDRLLVVAIPQAAPPGPPPGSPPEPPFAGDFSLF